MTNYTLYRDAAGISNPEMTRFLHQYYPGYNRVTSTFVNNPERSGLCLLPEAEAKLVEKFGKGPGLGTLKYAEPEKAPKKKRSDKRRKKNRITFRMSDEEFDQVIALADAYGTETMQELFERLLRDAFKRLEG